MDLGNEFGQFSQGYRGPSMSSLSGIRSASAAPKGPGGLKGFLVNNLPAIGGGVGGVAGLLVPGLDATGVSEIGGAALGSALGEHLKQSLLGENQGNIGNQLKQDVIQGGESAALGGVGKGLGMLRGGAKTALGMEAGQAAKTGGGNVISRFVGNQASKQAANEAAAKAAAVDSGFQGLGKVMQGGTTAVGAPYGYANAKAMVTRMGLPAETSDQLAASMQKLSDANQVVNQHLTTALESAGTVQTGNLEKAMTDAVQSPKVIGVLGALHTGGAADNTLAAMRGILQNAVYGGRGNVGNAVHAANILDGVKALEAAAKAAGTSDAAQAQRSVFNDFKGTLSGLLDQPNVKQAVSGYRIPASQAESLPAEFGPKLSQYITNAVNKGGAVQDVRSAMQPGVIAGQIAEAYGKHQQAGLEKAAAGNPFSSGEMPVLYQAGSAMHGNPVGLAQIVSRLTGGGLTGKLAGKLAPGAAESGANAAAQTAEERMLQSNPAATEALGGAAAPSAAAQAMPTLAAGAGGAKNIIGGLAGFGKRMAAAPLARPIATAGAVAKQAIGRGAGDLAMNGIPAPQQAEGQQPPTDQMGAAPGDASGQTPDMSNPNNDSMYGAANMMADISRDPKNASTYMSLYKMFNPNQSASSTTIKPNAQQYGEATSGVQSLQQLQDMIGKDPNIVNQTAIPGQGLPLVGGMIRNAAGTGDYQAAAQNTLDALARARTGAAMSKSEEAFYQRMLPQAGDNPDTIKFKIQQLSSAFQPFLQINQSQPQDTSQLQGATQ